MTSSSSRTHLWAILLPFGLIAVGVGGYAVWRSATAPPRDDYRAEMRAFVADAREGARIVRMSASPKDLSELRDRLVKRAVDMPPVSKDLQEGKAVIDDLVKLICDHATLVRDFKTNQSLSDYEFPESERTRRKAIVAKIADGLERIAGELESLVERRDR